MTQFAFQPITEYEQGRAINQKVNENKQNTKISNNSVLVWVLAKTGFVFNKLFEKL
jgi:hypothetical protein